MPLFFHGKICFIVSSPFSKVSLCDFLFSKPAIVVIVFPAVEHSSVFRRMRYGLCIQILQTAG